MEKAAWKELATSTARKFVGPMPARDFLDSFLPRTPGMARVPTLKLPKTFGDDTHRNLERAKDVLFSAIRTCRICPNYKFLAAPPHKRHEDWYYHSQVAFLYPKYFRVRSCADSWQSAQMFVTFVVEHVDPFDSTERQWRDDDDTPYARGRQISYAKSQIYHQHRAFTFSLSILGRRARFVRWDVAGAVFSESFDYVSQPTWLAQFFWRYNHLSSTQRGLDPHVEPATLAQSRMLTQAMKVYLGKVKIGVLPLIPMVEDTLDKRHPTYKIHFDLTDKTPPFDLIVRRPFYNKPIIEDSGTRCYIGYHLGLRRLVFLKDFWPPHTPKQGIIEPDMYHFLASLKVTHLPDVLYADTPFWRSSNANPSFSLTQDLAGKFQGCNASKHLYARIHARIVQDIAYPLKSARYSRQLVQAIRDALIAIAEAYSNGKVFHGDISSNNIMLTAFGRGILNDWDRGLLETDDQWETFGTWSYLSCGKLRDHRKQHDIKDDVEACFWVLLHQALRFFMPRNKHWDTAMFHEHTEYRDAAGRRVKSGGGQKLMFLLRCHDPGQKIPIPCAPLRDLVHDFRDVLSRFYLATRVLGHSPEDQQVLDTLQDPRAIAKLFDKALNRPDWPAEPDVVLDQYGAMRKHQSFTAITEFTDGLNVRPLSTIHDILTAVPAEQGSFCLWGDFIPQRTGSALNQESSTSYTRSSTWTPSAAQSAEAQKTLSVSQPLILRIPAMKDRPLGGTKRRREDVAEDADVEGSPGRKRVRPR